MKASISSEYFSMLDPYEMAKTFIEVGVYQTEINEQHFGGFLRREDDVKEYRKFIDDLGFSIPQGHLVFMNAGNITSIDNNYAIDN